TPYGLSGQTPQSFEEGALAADEEDAARVVEYGGGADVEGGSRRGRSVGGSEGRRSVASGEAVAAHGAGRAVGIARRANGGAEVHERLVEVARPVVREEAGDLAADRGG